MVAPGTYELGPHNGELLLHTAREGVAAKVGHDLTIRMGQWSARVEVAGPDPSTANVEATVQMASFEVLEGKGGAVPLRDADRREITSTASRLLDWSTHPQATFTSSSISGSADRAEMAGELTIRAQARTVTFVLHGETSVTATATIKQSDFGIKPYRAFLGALRLADEVRIEVTARLDAG
jgi:polyisoprenoid-binding protein YceI